MAAKLNLRPPFTTLATRSMATTFSFKSISLALTVLMLLTDIFLFLEFQSTFPCTFGQGFNISVIQVSIAIKHNGVDTRSNCFLGNFLPHVFRVLHVQGSILSDFDCRGRYQRNTFLIINDLRIYTAVTTEYR